MHLEQYLHINSLSLIAIMVLVIIISTLIPVCSWFCQSKLCYQSPSLNFSQSMNSQMPILCTTLWCKNKAGAEFIRRALGSGLGLASCLRQEHQRVNLRGEDNVPPCSWHWFYCHEPLGISSLDQYFEYEILCHVFYNLKKKKSFTHFLKSFCLGKIVCFCIFSKSVTF